MSCLFSKQIWVVPSLNPSKVFSDPPPTPFGFSVTTDPQGINNDRSLMRFAVIMQHANIAYHVQRAYKEPTIWLLKGEGGGGWLWYRWFHKKNILKSDFEHKKVLQGNTCHTIALYVREKHSITRGFGGKILTQTHEITHTLVKVKWPAPNYM